MAEIKSVLRLKGKEGTEIEAVVYYNETKEFDEGEIFFKHVLTGEEVDTIDKVLQNWNEQENELQKDWEYLVEAIKKDKELVEKIFAGVGIIEYIPVKFYINHNTGVGNDTEATFEKAMKTAINDARYTGESIIIEDEDNNILARLPWYSFPATEDDMVVICYGDFGFYGEWETA